MSHTKPRDLITCEPALQHDLDLQSFRPEKKAFIEDARRSQWRAKSLLASQKQCVAVRALAYHSESYIIDLVRENPAILAILGSEKGKAISIKLGPSSREKESPPDLPRKDVLTNLSPWAKPSLQRDDPRRIAASIDMFQRTAQHWTLVDRERQILLGDLSPSLWRIWIKHPSNAPLSIDIRERIANIFAIDLNLHSLFGAEFADAWIRQGNKFFDGKSPLSIMLRGKMEDIITVRRYLESVRTVH
jgi:hypothetical protein